MIHQKLFRFFFFFWISEAYYCKCGYCWGVAIAFLIVFLTLLILYWWHVHTSQNRKFKLRHSAFWGTAATDDVKEAMRLWEIRVLPQTGAPLWRITTNENPSGERPGSDFQKYFSRDRQDHTIWPITICWNRWHTNFSSASRSTISEICAFVNLSICASLLHFCRNFRFLQNPILWKKWSQTLLIVTPQSFAKIWFNNAAQNQTTTTTANKS